MTQAWEIKVVAVTHPILLQHVQDELVLVELKCASGTVPFNSYAKQETSCTEIATFEVLGKKLNILVHGRRGL